MRVKRETREQARQHRYTLLEKRVEVSLNTCRLSLVLMFTSSHPLSFALTWNILGGC